MGDMMKYMVVDMVKDMMMDMMDDMVKNLMMNTVMDMVMNMMVDMVIGYGDDIVMMAVVMSDHVMTGKWLRFVTKSFCNSFSLLKN